MFSLVSGEDGRPVVGANVLLSGSSTSGTFTQTYVSDPAGQIRLDRPVLYSPAPAVDITATGFLKRETLIRASDERTFSLWPSASSTGLSETLTGLMVYSTAQCPARFDPGTLQRHNPATKEVVYVLGPTVQAPADIERHQRAIDALNATTGNVPRYVISTVEPPSGVIVRVSVAPQQGSCSTGSFGAYTVLHGENRSITGAEVVYCSNVYASHPRTIAHELGHTMGLNHSDAPTPADLMSCTNAEAPTGFSLREALLVKLMLLRPPGNSWPDRDRPFSGVSPARVARTTQTIVCPKPTAK